MKFTPNNLARNARIYAIAAIAILLGIATAYATYYIQPSDNNTSLEVAGVSDEIIQPTQSPTANPFAFTNDSIPTIIDTSTPSPTPSSETQNSNTDNGSEDSTNDSSSTPTPSPTPTPTPSPTASPTPSATPTTQPTQSPAVHLNSKVLVILFVPYHVNPIYNPLDLSNQLVSGMRESTHNAINYTIVETKEEARSTTKRSSDGKMDYNALLDEFNICNRINNGEIDEVWVWVNGADGNGWEYAASGPDLNDWYSGMKSCGKNLFVMGFDYTRTWDLALHSMGHRMEFAAKAKHYNEYIAWDSRDGKYSTPYNTQIPLETDVVGCGNIHFPPNAQKHYDYTNSGSVQSDCSGQTETITCSIWGCSQEGFLKWWFSYIPSNWFSSFLGR